MVVSVSSEDIQAINALHSPSFPTTTPPSNLRDASSTSISTKASRFGWTKPPTPLELPQRTSMSVPRSQVINPFAGGRFKNNLDSSKDSSTYGNRQKKQTIVDHRATKRRKTTHNSAPMIAKEPQPSIHAISDDDQSQVAGSSSEFIQVPPRLRQQHERMKVKRKAEPTVISSDDDEEGKSDCASVTGPPDGEHLIWLKDSKKPVSKTSFTSHSPLTDQIEDFSDDAEDPQQRGFVKNQVNKIEKQNRNVVDLKTVKNGMKMRSQLQTLKFKKVTAPTGSKKTEYKILPLKEMYFGLRHFGADCYLSFKHRQGIAFTIRGPNKLQASFTFAQSVKSMQLGDVKVQEPCIQFLSKPIPPQRRMDIGIDLGDDFIPGERFKGEVTFKFDKKHSDWSDETYDQFRMLCKRMTATREVLGEGSQRALWSTTAGGLDFVEDDSLNIPSGSGDMYDEPPTPKEPSRIDEEQEPSRRERSAPKSSNAPENGTPADEARPRRSTRQQQNQAKKQPSEDPDEIILSYPPATPGAVNITNADLNRLLPNEFLNDTLIEFGLKLWLCNLEAEDPDLAKQIHIFNSFFYKKLNKKNPEEGYQSVRRWTSKFDIFDKKFIIVPINENMHWYLAIIYRPEYVLVPPPEREAPNTRQHTQPSNAHEELLEQTPDATPILMPNDIPTPDLPSPSTSTGAEVGSAISERRSPTASVAASRENSPALEIVRDPSSEADAEETVRRLTNIEISLDIHNRSETSPSPVTSFPGAAMDADGGKSLSSSLIPSPSFSAITTSPRDPREDSRRMEVDGHQPPESSANPRVIDGGSDDGEAESGNLDAFKSTSIAPSRFYAPVSRKGKEKAKDSSADTPNGDAVMTDPPVSMVSDRPMTVIYTLDSLGNRHTKVPNVLSRYLQFEAKDKKNFDNPSKAVGRNLAVPTQPNFCDCGVYLIHFAQVFVKKAEYFADISQRKGTRSSNDRSTDWEGQRLNGFRDELREEVIRLSNEWRAHRTQQQGREKESNVNDGQPEPTVHELSDSDVDIVETKPAPSPNRKVKGRPSRVRG